MVYVGVLVQMLGIKMEAIQQALTFHFKGKEGPINSNLGVIRAGAEWAAQNLKKNDPYIVEQHDRTDGLIMADGNTAGALGAIYGGIEFAAWYPITPASSLAESLNVYLPQLPSDEGWQVIPMPCCRQKMKLLRSAWPWVPAGPGCDR